MTEDGPEAAPGSPDGPEGVFGNLPSTRPGSRSPRRRSTDAQADAPAEEPVAAEAQSEAEAPTPEPHTPEPEPSNPDSPDPEDGLAGSEPAGPPKSVEDLAWAGVAVVANAATAGIRFTSKALEAARKSIDRP